MLINIYRNACKQSRNAKRSTCVGTVSFSFLKFDYQYAGPIIY